MSAFRDRLGCLLVTTLATLMIGVVDASAQRIEIVHAFPASPQNPSGKLLELAPGLLVGTSYAGGAYGQGSVYLMYRRADQVWATFTVHSFYDTGGRNPAAGVIRASDGNFYGTTVHGGINNYGTIFRLTPSLKFSTMHAFTSVEGERPATSLVQAPDGSLWGTTSNGGGTNSNAGTVFRMTLGGQFTKVYTFGGVSGGVPGQLLISSIDGHFYGTTAFGEGGGINGSGTVFRLTQAGVFSTLHRFAEDGVDPFTMIEAADGHLYGVRRDGGATSVGFAFRITRNGVFTKLHDFDAFVDGVWYPVPGSFVQAPDGFIYGTTSARLVGGVPVFEGGAAYRMSLTGEVLRVADLDASTFGGPPSGLIVASDGSLYGTTSHGQRPEEFVDANSGVLFTLPVSGPATVLYDYATAAPRLPLGRLVEGPDGKLYGTSCAGGRYDRGTVFRLDGSATTTLHSFTGGDGVCPASGLAVGSDGAFYGTALAGLTSPTTGGTIYRMMADGSHRTLWSRNSFDGDPRFPQAAPSMGPDGRLYVPIGALAAVMRIEADSTVTFFADLSNTSELNGQWMTGPLLAADDGNFYATTSTRPGAVLRLSMDGTFTPVYQFPYEPGRSARNRRSGVIQGADGRLYGASQQGGGLDAGVVYSTDYSGSISVLHEFNYADGNAPSGELIEMSPGRFVGVTNGVTDPRYGLFGTLFEVTSAGGSQTLHRFSWRDGAGPLTGLTRTSSGEIYGTTMVGGPLGGGVIFRFVPSASQK